MTDRAGRQAAAGEPGTRPGEGFCAVAPSPELRERLKAAGRDAVRAFGLPPDGAVSPLRERRRFGLNDGVILPPAEFPPGVEASRVRRAAATRAPLRGTVRVVVVLVDFEDKPFGETTQRFTDLFFSRGAVPTGSVLEYFDDVTGGLIEIAGEVVGPLRMPQPLAWYANGNYGIGEPSGEPRAQFLARDAVKAADPLVDLAPYDNDGNGYVDAFIVVHAGSGGEVTGEPGDIWSHKWVLDREYRGDGAKVYAYLTIPEDARLGVSAHELGHLLFGFPDLYDTDYTSAGVGRWCLMAGGSWNGGGDTPAHPSAWCKAQQGWVTVQNVTADAVLELDDVKTSRTVHRLWTDGGDSPEYFLVENRQQVGYDAQIPGSGMLVWHCDDTRDSNADEEHQLVALVQADGLRELELDLSQGDPGDPYPGSTGNRQLSGVSNPASTSYAGQDSGVVLSRISDSGDTMSVAVSVSGTVPGGGGGDDLDALRAEVEALRRRVGDLERAVAEAASALGRVVPPAVGVPAQRVLRLPETPVRTAGHGGSGR